MSTFAVFHAKDIKDSNGNVIGIRGGFGFVPALFPDDYRLVAKVEASAIGEVFQLTNHIHSNWTDNMEAVSIPTGVNRLELRSTSVGDIIAAVNPGRETDYFAVAPIGLKSLANLDENFTIKVPKLYGEAV